MKLAIKLSGKVLEDADLRASLGLQVATLVEAGHAVVLIHGAGKQLTDFCRERQIPVVQVQGRRVTDAATLQAAVQVFSGVNADLTAALLAAGVAAVGISGFAGGLVEGRRRPPQLVRFQADGVTREETVDFGFVGDITGTRPAVIEAMWSVGLVPVVSSLCAEGAQILNINADTLATELSLALGVDRLIAVSDVDGIYLDPARPATRIPVLTRSEARRYLAEGIFRDGMVPKVENALRLLEKGIPAFQVISGMLQDALAGCLEDSSGTLMVA